MTILKNIVRFVGLMVGVPVTLPHLINVNGDAALPQVNLPRPLGDMLVVVDDVNVTVTRGAAGPMNVDVYVEHWHSYEAALPPGGLMGLVPFILEGSAAAPAGVARSSLPTTWEEKQIPANLVNAIAHAADSTLFDEVDAFRPGSITGIRTRLTTAILAGTLTVKVSINGVPTAAVLVHTSVINPSGGGATFVSGAIPFNTGDRIGVLLDTDALFGPNSNDLDVWLEVEA